MQSVKQYGGLNYEKEVAKWSNTGLTYEIYSAKNTLNTQCFPRVFCECGVHDHALKISPTYGPWLLQENLPFFI